MINSKKIINRFGLRDKFINAQETKSVPKQITRDNLSVIPQAKQPAFGAIEPAQRINSAGAHNIKIANGPVDLLNVAINLM